MIASVLIILAIYIYAAALLCKVRNTAFGVQKEEGHFR